MTTPAEFGESQTSSFSSRLSGTSPKVVPFEPDVAPFAVAEPRDEVARPDMGIGVRQLLAHLAGDRVGLRALFRLQPLALQHVLEIAVAAEIELVGAVEPHAAVAKQIGEHAMHDRRADLALDVVADQRQPAAMEFLAPPGILRDEHRDAVDKGAAGGQRLLGIPARRLLGADRQIGNQTFRPRCRAASARHRRPAPANSITTSRRYCPIPS